MPPTTDHGGTGAPGRPTVLVTGAAGFLGSHVVESLSAAGKFDVLGTDVVRSDRTDALTTLPGVRFHATDLRDESAIDELIRDCDSVVHLAAVRMKASSADPRAAHDINVGATYGLISLAAKHSLRRFVFGSSHTVYGSFADPNVSAYREADATVRPGLSMYAASKLAVEAFLSAFAAAAGPEYVSLRFGTIYGPRVNLDSNNGILLAVLEAMGQGRRPAIPWARDSVHALTYVGDAANAVVRALEVDGESGPVNVVGEPMTAEVMYTTLVKLAGGDPAVLDWRDERTRYQLVNADRLRSVLGIEHRTSLETGLSTLIDWYRSGRA
ncbi:NAD(P)-dependent oxidoreductase [Amycolatopsis sp. NPDC051371]|uniref:NAD-dependent epimerase/dehydratase family protein n=1 Tax=Amycolatopsis sp. NPDC051371 TaxID=3155800 RepID=UPI00341FA99E